MNLIQYQQACKRTEPSAEQCIAISERLKNSNAVDIVHAGMGITTEAGELQDTIKKHIIYGQPLDCLNIREELGDLLWYIALLANSLEIDLQDICQENVDKLKLRYPSVFSEEDAYERKDKSS